MKHYPDQNIVDIDFGNIIGKNGYNYVPLQTSPDGNCLFNAVSMFLCGNEEENYNLKLASVFIIVEYENFFRTFIINKGFNFSYDSFVSNTAKIGVWGNSLNIIALSFLTSRAINCFESNNSVSYNPFFNPYYFPIILVLQNSSFCCC